MKEENKIIKGRKIVLPIVILLLLPFCLCTCMDDDETSKKKEVSNQPELAEAINYMKGKKLSMLNLEKTFGSSTRFIQENESDNTGLTPDWNTLRTIKKENCEIQLFLLKSEFPIAGFVQTRISGKIKEELSTATLKLALWKIDGKLEGRIITYIPNRKFIRNPENDVKELGYPLDGSCFSGICLVSTLDGGYQFGECYNEGVCLFNFFPHKPQKKELVLDQIYKEEEKLASTHIFFNLISEKTTQTRATYSTNEENIDGICPFCYKNYGNCACNVVIIAPQTRCENCFLPRDYCICCSKCHRYPCICSGGGGTTGGGGSVGGGGSIGGNTTGGSSPSIIISGKIKNIFGANKNLTQQQVNSLSTLFDSFTEGTVGSKCQSVLIRENIKIDFRMDSSRKNPASFISYSNEIVFKDNLSLNNSIAFAEEMTHTLQYYGYYGDKMISTIVNYDFEAKLLGDIVCSSEAPYPCAGLICHGMESHQEYNQYVDDYNQFIIHIFDKGWNNATDYNIYSNLCQGWHKYQKKYEPNGSYAKAFFDKNLSPQVLINLFPPKK